MSRRYLRMDEEGFDFRGEGEVVCPRIRVVKRLYAETVARDKEDFDRVRPKLRKQTFR